MVASETSWLVAAGSGAPPAVEPASVLLIGAFLSCRGGVRAVGEELAERLRLRGWPVLTASSATNRFRRLMDMTRTAWKRRDGYRVAHVDVFSGRAFLWAEAACWALRRADRRYVLTLRGGNLPGFARKWPGRVRRLLASAVAVTAPSRYLAEQMSPYRADILLLPNALELNACPFTARTSPSPRLVWLRAFHEIYNPGMAIRVLALLQPEFPEIRLTMVGPDKGDGSLRRARRLAERLGVCDHVSFAGGVPKKEVPRWLNQGDIFLNTTNVDNTPVSVLEAMACGLCVVSTDVGGVPYLVGQGQDALLVGREDPEAMACAVRRILQEPGLAQRLSENGRVKVEQLDWSVVLPQWESLLSSVAQG